MAQKKAKFKVEDVFYGLSGRDLVKKMQYKYKIIFKFSLSLVMCITPVFVFAQTPEDTEPIPTLIDNVDTDQTFDLESPVENYRIGIETTDKDVVPIEIPSDNISFDQVEVPPIQINIEQLSWNEFRFRPSFQLGAQHYEYTWDFGDGNLSNERFVKHTYSAPGSFTVTLQILDHAGVSDSVITQVNVGFFNTANWRLWVVSVIIALIIIIAVIIVRMTDTENKGKYKKKVKDGKGREGSRLAEILDFPDSNISIDKLSDIGLDSSEFAKELALLEKLEKNHNGNILDEDILKFIEETKKLTATKIKKTKAPTKKVIKRKVVSKKKVKKSSTKNKKTSRTRKNN